MSKKFTAEVEVSLDDFDTDDLISELLSRKGHSYYNGSSLSKEETVDALNLSSDALRKHGRIDLAVKMEDIRDNIINS